MKKLFLVLIVAVFAFGCKKDNDSSAESIVMINSSYYNKLKEENKGKVLIVNVFASWCPPCKVETPDFVEFYSQKGDNDFEIIGLSIDESSKDLIKFMDKYGVNYPVYRITPELQRKLYAERIPTTVVYNPNGMMFTSILGVINGEQLGEIIDKASQLE